MADANQHPFFTASALCAPRIQPMPSADKPLRD
jgi:hypothetical protein